MTTAITTYNRATGSFKDTDEFYTSAANGAISHTVSAGKDMFLKEIRLHLSSAATQETFTASISNTNTRLNFVLVSQAMNGLTDVLWVADNDEGMFVPEGASLLLSFTNTDARAWGLSVVIKR